MTLILIDVLVTCRICGMAFWYGCIVKLQDFKNELESMSVGVCVVKLWTIIAYGFEFSYSMSEW